MTLDLLNNFLSNLPEGFIGNNTHADLIQQLAGQADAKANEYKATTSAETEAATQDEKELVQIACNELQSKQDEIDGVEEQIRELFATLALKKLELEELAQSVVETNNDYKAALSTIKNEQVKVFNTIRAEQDIVATFLKTAEIITDNVDKSFAGEYVDIQTVLIDTLETLKQAGFDLDDDATHAALFALDLHDSAELEIKSKADYQELCESIAHNNRICELTTHLNDTQGFFNAICADLPPQDIYQQTDRQIQDFESAIENAAAAFDLPVETAYNVFFSTYGDQLEQPTTSKQAYLELAGNLRAEAKAIEYSVITALYQEMTELDRNAPNYRADLFEAIQEIEEDITEAAARHGTDEDTAYNGALSEFGITNKVTFGDKTKYYMYDVNIEDIAKKLSAFKTSEKTQFSPDELERLKTANAALEGRHGKRLSVAGVSSDTLTTLTQLRQDFMSAFEQAVTPKPRKWKKADTTELKAIEDALTDISVQAVTEMNATADKRKLQL
ncbi:MAG: hypothetical protein VX740_04460 [Pseudomonadota bacterium]|nr:hypothetical protein [Pseudomonadota bacterium]MEC9236457.1 hypothetical protein [Pseudomonadota bacterium]MED5422674.1 hypothetical protein [Pseudomonadota bacterium]